MRRNLIVVGVVAALLITAALIAPFLINVDKYRPQIQVELEQKLGRKVEIGPLSLHVIPLSVTVESVTIGESPEFPSSHPFLSARNAKVSVELLPLISGKPVIDSLSVNGPRIELIRNGKGVWNFSTLAKGNSSSGSDSSLTLKALDITDGQVGYTDALTHRPRAVYDHIDASLRDFAPHSRFGVKLSAHVPGQGNQLLAVDAKVGPVPEGEAMLTQVDGKLSLKQVSLAGLGLFLGNSMPPDSDSTMSGDADFKTANNEILGKGALRLDGTTLRGKKLDYPVDARYDIGFNPKTNVLNVKPSEIKLGSTPISLAGQLDSGKTPPEMNMHVATNNATITEIAHLLGSVGVAFNPQYQIRGNITADVTAQGPTNMPRLTGTISVSGLEVNGGEIKQAVRVPQLQLNLSPDVVKSNSFQVLSGSTRLEAQVSASKYATKSAVIDASLRTSDANLAEFLNMAKAYGADAEGMSGTGRLSLNVRVQGAMDQPAHLVYSGNGSITGAVLNTPSLNKPLNVSTASIKFAQNDMTLENLTASLTSTTVHGNLSVRNFNEPDVQFNVTADKVNTDELQAAQNKTPAKPGQKGAAAGAAKSPLEKITGTGTIAIGTVIAGNITLTNLKSGVKLNHGVIDLSPLTADVYNGKETGTVVLDTRPVTATCSVRAKLTGVDANQVLTATSSLKNTLYGSLNADSNVTFVLASGDQLIRTLNGTLAFNVVNGELKNVNIMNEVGRVGKFLGMAGGSSGNNTPINKLAATANFKNGVANTDNLTAILNEGSLAGKGWIDLASQALDMNLSAVLGKQASSAVGGSQVGGILTTVLANSVGELVIPVHVTGSMSKPVFTPDAVALMTMKSKNALPTSADPSKAAAGIINGLLGGQAAQKPGSNPTADAVNGLLGAFGPKKKTTKQ